MIGQTVGHYHVQAKLGEGGMGEVFLARDQRLGRLVALKFLGRALAGQPEAEARFGREARTIAALSHPHICTLFDLGHDDYGPFLVMEYVHGTTLAERLEAGPMPVDEALVAGAQIARALAAAHTQGVIHRDLKPANIKLTPTGAKVLDFGLAQSVPQSASSTDGTATVTAFESERLGILGTPHYMSPEQARGEALDARTDAWALGVVLYEMFTGRRLFSETNPFAVLAAVAAQPIDLTALPAAVPEPVRHLMSRLLDRARRTRERDLTLAAALLAGDRDSAHRSDRTPTTCMVSGPRASVGRLSILVLPFANSSADPENEYFSDGLTEEVIADLSTVTALRVVSRTSAMRLKTLDRPLATIATEFGVRYVLEGGVRKSGRDVRITVQLVDTEADATVWSHKYGGSLDDVFAMQERVARDVVAALSVTLTAPEDRKLNAPSRPSGFAYDTYLRTRRDIWSFMPDRLERARAELTHALELCGDDVWLHTGLSLVHWQYVNGGLSGDRRHLEDARTHAERVLALDPAGARGPQLLGLIAGQSGDLVNWIRHLERAVAIDPHDPDTTIWLAFAWTFAGHPERARPHFARQLAADPMFDYLFWGLGMDAYYNGRFGEALQHYEKGRRLSPEHPGGPMVMAQTLGTMGEIERMARYVDDHVPDPHAHALSTLTHIFKHALLGQGGEVDRLYSDAVRDKLWSDFQYTHIMGQALAALGRTDDALIWLRRTVDRGFTHYPFFAERDPLIAALRGVPAFDSLLEAVRVRWASLGAIGSAELAGPDGSDLRAGAS